MGLAPQIVEEIFKIVKDLNEKEGVSFLLAEQNTNMALRFARYGYILENGRVVMDGEAKALAENEDVKEFYLGISEGRRKSFREGKHYRRRKRWLRLTCRLLLRWRCGAAPRRAAAGVVAVHPSRPTRFAGTSGDGTIKSIQLTNHYDSSKPAIPPIASARPSQRYPS
jgi:ABC-type multidrug transport system ATPase subunit